MKKWENEIYLKLRPTKQLKKEVMQLIFLFFQLHPRLRLLVCSKNIQTLFIFGLGSKKYKL
jgi:hypothetical protein